MVLGAIGFRKEKKNISVSYDIDMPMGIELTLSGGYPNCVQTADSTFLD